MRKRYKNYPVSSLLFVVLVTVLSTNFVFAQVPKQSVARPGLADAGAGIPVSISTVSFFQRYIPRIGKML